MSSLEDKLLGSINKPEKDATDTAAKPAAKKPAAKKPAAKNLQQKNQQQKNKQLRNLQQKNQQLKTLLSLSAFGQINIILIKSIIYVSSVIRF